MKMLRALFGAGFLLTAAPAIAAPVCYMETNGIDCTPVSAATPLPTTGSGGGGAGDASAANQTAVQANAGSDATKATAVQGITGGKAVPISAASLPLPSGAATSAKQPALGTAGSASTDVITVQGIASGVAQPISGSLTNISGTISLPTGASTAAKQPALGTAGTASSDVITVQGIASMTALKVEQSTTCASTAAYDGTNNINPCGMARAVADTAISTAATKVKASPSATSTDGITPVVSSAAESCHVLKASAGNLYSASGYIGAAGFIMVFNATSAPSDGAVTPIVWLYAAAAGSWSVNYGLMPAVFSTGITVCASSTGPLTKTAYSTNTVFSGNIQ